MQIARLSLFFLVHELPFWPYRSRNVPQQNASDLNFQPLNAYQSIIQNQ